jgi:hypothetical protein
MMDQELPDEDLDLELEEVEINNLNQLTNLGNQAVKLRMILGHGYHGGQYEILHSDKVLLMSALEAQSYLEELIDKNPG